MSTPEDRLRAALNDRAEVARTSPDALDGVFDRVARRRRRVRALAGAGSALALVAGGLVANAALREPARRVVSGDAAPTASASTSPSISSSPSPSPSPDLTDAHLAVVVTKDGRMSVVETTRGTEVRRIGTHEGVREIAWSPDRRTVAVVSGCILMLWDVEQANPRADLGNARHPAFSPDGTRIASSPCERATSVTVLDLGGREQPKTYPAPSPSPGGDFFLENAGISSLAWLDEHSLDVASEYEGSMYVRRLDPSTDRSLAEARTLPYGADVLTASGEATVVAEDCCYPYFEKPTVFSRADGTRATKLFDHPNGITSIAVDRRGTVLFVDKEGLWSWHEGTDVAVLLRADVVAVDA